MLDEFVTVNREEIIRRCRANVATRLISTPTGAEVNHGVPVFLDQLVRRLRLPRIFSSEIGTGAALHGHDLLLKGFTVSQVVHDYGDVCQTITELALQMNAPISTDDFRMLNQCLDEAIAGAVTVYGRESQQSRLDGQAERENQRLGFFAHELRNLVNTGILAFEVLKTGNVGLGGSTGAVLNRSLMGLRDLISRSLAEVRLTQGVQNKERISVSDLINELGTTATLDANARGIRLIVPPVEVGLTIVADQQVLGAVVRNLLQNAFKFTRPHSTVTLTVGASADRVLIQIQDECGGLPGGGDFRELFRPFEQRGTDRTGVGIGLAFSRWGAEANNGRLYARNLPDKGCVFTVDLPRCPVLAVALVEAGRHVDRRSCSPRSTSRSPFTTAVPAVPLTKCARSAGNETNAAVSANLFQEGESPRFSSFRPEMSITLLG
jgi:signal transduction histidine kinase